MVDSLLHLFHGTYLAGLAIDILLLISKSECSSLKVIIEETIQFLQD